MPVEIAAARGYWDCLEVLFSVTIPLPGYDNWSIIDIVRYTNTVSLELRMYLRITYFTSVLNMKAQYLWLLCIIDLYFVIYLLLHSKL